MFLGFCGTTYQWAWITSLSPFGLFWILRMAPTVALSFNDNPENILTMLYLFQGKKLLLLNIYTKTWLMWRLTLDFSLFFVFAQDSIVLDLTMQCVFCPWLCQAPWSLVSALCLSYLDIFFNVCILQMYEWNDHKNRAINTIRRQLWCVQKIQRRSITTRSFY